MVAGFSQRWASYSNTGAWKSFLAVETVEPASVFVHVIVKSCKEFLTLALCMGGPNC